MRRALLLALLLASTSAAGHGIMGHMHVTGWAIENLPESELRAFFQDPEVKNAALFGAAYTDSGYGQPKDELKAAARAYSEHTHWEPFIADFVAWLGKNDPPPWTTLEQKKRVAFLMGCAAHGLQDEIFDSLFLPQVELRDKGGQDNADPGTDGFLALDGKLRFFPTPYYPIETVLALYKKLPEGVTQNVIDKSVKVVVDFYVNAEFGVAVAKTLGTRHEPALPWTRKHYLDSGVPGSLTSEIVPTMNYLLAIWERLHGRLGPERTVSFTFPDPPRRIAGTDAATPDSWVTILYGVGVARDSLSATWSDSAGGAVSFERRNTRWDAEWTRLHRLQPSKALVPGENYTVSAAAGLVRIDGQKTAQPVTLTFQAPCATTDDPKCPPLGPLPEAKREGATPYPMRPEAPPVVEVTPVAEPSSVAEPAVVLDAGVSAAPSPSAGGCQPTGDRSHGLGLLLCLLLALLGLRPTHAAQALTQRLGGQRDLSL